jgi:hypothetical protein
LRTESDRTDDCHTAKLTLTDENGKEYYSAKVGISPFVLETGSQVDVTDALFRMFGKNLFAFMKMVGHN